MKLFHIAYFFPIKDPTQATSFSIKKKKKSATAFSGIVGIMVQSVLSQVSQSASTSEQEQRKAIMIH